jgi:hypothetical protein
MAVVVRLVDAEPPDIPTVPFPDGRDWEVDDDGYLIIYGQTAAREIQGPLGKFTTGDATVLGQFAAGRWLYVRLQ